MVATLKIIRKLNQKIIRRKRNTNYHELIMNGCAQQLYEQLHGNYMLKKDFYLIFEIDFFIILSEAT